MRDARRKSARKDAQERGAYQQPSSRAFIFVLGCRCCVITRRMRQKRDARATMSALAYMYGMPAVLMPPYDERPYDAESCRFHMAAAYAQMPITAPPRYLFFSVTYFSRESYWPSTLYLL